MNFFRWLIGMDADVPKNETIEAHREHCKAKKGNCPFEKEIVRKATEEDIVSSGLGSSDPDKKDLLNKEMESVVRKYTKPDGTKTIYWMKAPNGKNTALNEHQWVLARTPSFKSVFGDWEGLAMSSLWREVADRDELRKMAPVDISETVSAVDKKEIKAILSSFGAITNEKDGRIVHFPNETAGKLVFVKQYVRSFNVLFSGAMRIYSEDVLDTDGKKAHENVAEVHQYANAFTFNGRKCYVRFGVRENKVGKPEEKNNVHSATVSDIALYECEQKETAPKMPGFKTGWVGAKGVTRRSHLDNKLAYFLCPVNPETVSDKRDQNGEPLTSEIDKIEKEIA